MMLRFSFSCFLFLAVIMRYRYAPHPDQTTSDQVAIVENPRVVWCSAAFCLQTANFFFYQIVQTGSRNNKRFALLWNFPYILFTTRTWVFQALFLYLALGQGSGTEILCRIPDTVPDKIEKKKIVLYHTVPRGGGCRIPVAAQIQGNLYSLPCYQYAEYLLLTRCRGNQLSSFFKYRYPRIPLYFQRTTSK